MSKFKVLQSNQAYMARLGLYSYRLTEPTNEFFSSIATYCIIFYIFTINIVAGVVWIYQNFDQLVPVLDACKATIVSMQGLGMFINVRLKMQKVKELHLKKQDIADQAAEGEEYDIYWITEQKCRKIVKKFIIFVYCEQLYFIIGLIFPFYCICRGNFDTSAWPLTFNIFCPFDVGVLWGWFLKWFIDFNMSFTYVLCVTSVTSYFVCCCLYLEAMCEQFDLKMRLVGELVTLRNAEKSTSKRQELFKRIKSNLNASVNLHVNIFEIFYLLSDISSGAIFALLPSNAILLGLAIYKMEYTSSAKLDFFNIVFDILNLLCSLLWPYLFCQYAIFSTNRIPSVGYTAYETNWYEYPKKLRGHIRFIIRRSQEPIAFMGLGLIACNVEVFGNIVKSAFSYYLIFRSISQR